MAPHRLRPRPPPRASSPSLALGTRAAAAPRRCRAVMRHRPGHGAARGSGAAGAERAANMAGVADAAAAAAPGSGGEGRRGGALEQQESGRGEPKTLWGSSESRPPPAGPGQPSPQQRTETLGFYESDRGRKKKRGLSGEGRRRRGERPPPAGRVGWRAARAAGLGWLSPWEFGVAGRGGVAWGGRCLRGAPPALAPHSGARPGPPEGPGWVLEAGLRASRPPASANFQRTTSKSAPGPHGPGERRRSAALVAGTGGRGASRRLRCLLSPCPEVRSASAAVTVK